MFFARANFDFFSKKGRERGAHFSKAGLYSLNHFVGGKKRRGAPTSLTTQKKIHSPPGETGQPKKI